MILMMLMLCCCFVDLDLNSDGFDYNTVLRHIWAAAVTAYAFRIKPGSYAET